MPLVLNNPSVLSALAHRCIDHLWLTGATREIALARFVTRHVTAQRVCGQVAVTMWVLIVNSGGSNHHIDFPGFVAMVKAAFADMHCHDVKFMVRSPHSMSWPLLLTLCFWLCGRCTRRLRVGCCLLAGEEGIPPSAVVVPTGKRILRPCQRHPIRSTGLRVHVRRPETAPLE